MCLRILLLLVMLQVLPACLQGFGAESGGSASPFFITGVASAGRIRNGAVTVYLLSSTGERGQVLAQGLTDENGNFTLSGSLDKNSAALPLEISVRGGTYAEESGGATVSLGSRELRARVSLNSSSTEAAITPLTEIAVERSDELIKGRMGAGAAVEQANREISQVAGVKDVVGTLPADPDKVLTDGNAPGAAYLLVLAGISSYARTNSTDSVQVAKALAQDFGDGIFDGTKQGVVLTLDAAMPVALATDAWSTGVANGIGTYIAGADNHAGLTSTNTPSLSSTVSAVIPSGWSKISTVNQPTPRAGAAAIWTGSEMFLWGGTKTSSYFNSGGLYNPASDTWRSETASGLTGRQFHTMVWAPEVGRAIVWGGRFSGALGDGGRFRPPNESVVCRKRRECSVGALQSHGDLDGQRNDYFGAVRVIPVLLC